MKVFTRREHRDDTDRVRHPGEFYDAEPERAEDLHRNGYVDNLFRVGEGGWLEQGGRILTPWPVASMADPVVIPADSKPIRSMQFTIYDPGNAAYRYHSAANSAAGGVSAFTRYEHSSPYCDLRQYDGKSNEGLVAEMTQSADAIHVHMDYKVLDEGVRRWPDRSRQLLVRHYHGSDAVDTVAPKFIENQIDNDLGAVQIGARLYHNRYSPNMQWLPIPVPVLDYQELRRRFFVPIEEREKKRFRLCHSPTHWRLKGTVALECVIQDLDAEGLPVDLVMIKDMRHGDALAVKASCDATFDSFWLGMQGSGLEAAAMGQPVLAGDPLVVEDYAKIDMACPYTFTKGSDELKDTIRRLVNEPEFVASEGARVAKYTSEYHDYPVVGARYWQIIRSAMAERGLRGPE